MRVFVIVLAMLLCLLYCSHSFFVGGFFWHEKKKKKQGKDKLARCSFRIILVNLLTGWAVRKAKSSYCHKLFWVFFFPSLRIQHLFATRFVTVSRCPVLLLAWCLLGLTFSIKATLNWSSSITSLEGPCRIDLPPAFYLLRTSELPANEERCRSSTAQQDIDASRDIKVFRAV